MIEKRRGRMEIIADILKSIQNKGGKIKPTHLLYKSNLSHAKLKEYVDILLEKDLIEEKLASPPNARAAISSSHLPACCLCFGLVFCRDL